jgi:ankyrin repeat protein
LTDKPLRFLLASLHVDSLVSKKTTTKLKSALENLSHGSGALGDAYNKAIDRIDGQEHDDCTLAKSVLSWISYARRPLTTEELCHALAVEIGDEEIDPENIPDVEDILSVCAGLVTIDEESQIIRLAHYTTQEYLEGIRETWHPNAQQEIASTCLTYLCFDSFKSVIPSENAEFESRHKEYSFLYYSARYWPEHVAVVQEKICELAMTLLHDSDLVASAQLHRNRLYNPFISREVTGLHLTASHGLLHLSMELLSWTKEEKMGLCNMKNDEGETPLFLAVVGGHRDMVELLLATGEVDVNVKDRNEVPALIEAVKRGHKEIVDLLLGTGEVDVNVQEDYGHTALMLAVHGEHREIVQLLLGTGEVDVNVQNIHGQTALLFAVEKGHKEIAELLLGTGKVDIDVEIHGWTALWIAVRKGHKDIVEMLLRSGKAGVDKTPDKAVLLMYAVDHGYKDMVEFLLGISTDTSKVTDRWPLLALIAANRHRGIAELMGSEEVDLDKKDDFGGQTLLVYAARGGHEDLVKLLLNAGADIEAKTNSGITALMEAAESNEEKVVELLLDRGADIHAKDNDGSTALMIVAVQQGCKEMVELLLDRGADIHAKDNDGSTALMMVAARQGCKEMVELLLDRGADIHAEKEDGSTALIVAAARWDCKETVELLLDRGADIHAKNKYGSTALTVAAAFWYCKEQVELLLDRGADVHAKNNDGSTALMLAEKGRYKGIADLLRAHVSRL